MQNKSWTRQKKKHRTLLHLNVSKWDYAVSANTGVGSTRDNQIISYAPHLFCSLTSVANQVIFIATSRVRVIDCACHSKFLREFLDTAAHASLITKAAARSLNSTTSHVNVPIVGINCTFADNASWKVQFTLKSFRYGSFTTNVGALTVLKITNLVLQSPLQMKKWWHVCGLPLADPDFAMPGETFY